MKKVHFVGVGGAGTSAAAALAKEYGFAVSGCDTDKESIYLPELEKLGIRLEYSHEPRHLEDSDILVISAAINKFDPENPETTEARKKNILILPTEKFVSDYLVENKFLIAVAGSHGKSTTTAMIGQILEDTGFDPTVYVGALASKWERNYRFGKSKYFVLEADEYEDKFLNYRPNVGAITNIEFDHPDFFKGEEQLIKSFVNFVKGFKKESKLILGTEVSKNENIQKLIKETENLTTIIENYDSDNFGIRLQLPGRHNLFNAQVAYLAAKAIGVEGAQIKKTLSNFSGISRRFEFKGEVNSIKIFDDYAHHPTEVASTLRAARERFSNERIWCVFQPHTFSRTSALFEDFVKSFEGSDVDKLIFVDIYAAREKSSQNISSLDLVRKIKNKKAVYIGDIEEAASYVAANTTGGDVVIVMGAGDVYKLSPILINKLKGQHGRKKFS